MYESKGLTGLANLGNTCFVNSCLQILSHTYELNDLLNNPSYKTRLNNKYETALLVEWDNLRTMMWKENCIISPGKFIKTLQKLSQLKGVSLFTGFAQNDLPEFLLFVIDCFHVSLQREVKMTIVGTEQNNKDKLASECFEMIRKMYNKDYSEIWNMFYGIHVSQIKSFESDNILSRRPEPFFMVDLSIPQNNKEPSLLDCMDLYVEGESMIGDNAWFNETTKQKEDVKKGIIFWSFPNILVIDFKRFNARGIKNQILITFPLEELNLSKYVIGYKPSSYVYDLYAVANHTGSTLGGHYYAMVKNANGKWYMFNDTEVSEITDLTKIVSPKAYCLFYRKRKSD
jgi:ubiquitin C-terminal hydrolase